MQNPKLKITKPAFTLVELLVVISIIGILGVMAVPSMFKNIKRSKYENSIIEVVSLIKEARNNAIIGKFTKSGTTLTTPKGGYGILIDKDNGIFTSFIDKDESQSFSTNDVKLNTYKLPEETIILSMSGVQSTLNYNLPDTNSDFNSGIILFIPPQGETILNENNSDKNLLEMNFILERYDRLKSKKLKINRISGFIETE